VPIEDVFFPGDFETQNDRFAKFAREIAVDLARRALASAGLEPGQVDLVVSVSCTGFMIPAMDAHVADALGLGPAPGAAARSPRAGAPAASWAWRARTTT
jgi:1,3,6,8-tetrahydroxynaphthalene synthase